MHASPAAEPRLPSRAQLVVHGPGSMSVDEADGIGLTMEDLTAKGTD
jgi:hypothetical protein